jgi:hypothetical protein
VKVRYAFLDVYRGLIVLLMIEGHAVRELLLPSLQSSGAFRFHEIIHGVTGPGFLFGAGITFGISVQHRWSEFLSLTSTLVQRVRKISLLILLGYALHLPFLSLQKTLSTATPEQWLILHRFDVLQCIGFTLLIAHLLMLFVRRERWFPAVLSIATLGVLFTTTSVWEADLSRLPAEVVMALQGNFGSFYPLFPYSAFLFAGAFASYEFLKFAEMGREEAFAKRLALVGLVMLAGSGTLLAVDSGSGPAVQSWNSDPVLMFTKLGSLLMLLSGAWMFEKRLRSLWDKPSMKWIVLLGVESLFVYVLHLMVLYGSVINADLHLSALWRGRLDWAPALGISFAFTAVLAAVAWSWNRIKAGHPVLFRVIIWWMAVVFGYEFLMNAY